jgi:predicted  nucleic acid-binding Zn-ribbon protein
MTTVKQLYALQEVDLDLDRVYRALGEAEEELKIEVSIENLETAFQEEQERMQEVELRQRDNQIDIETRRERTEVLETQLYDGSMINARDLEALQHEAASTRHLLEQDEALSLELSIQVEESRSRCASLEQQLSETRARWEVQQVELNRKVNELRAEQGEYEKQRELLASRFDPATLQRYETLRKSKGGRAVAKVERDLCQGCRMSLPTQLRQRVKSGRQAVNCSSCGRMLFVE